jgi:glycosyltransferase involved in cell wall biosynthesis
MTLEPRVSIITPVYNAENFIAETIDSVLNSDIKVSYEYLVLNDGSQDSTPGILERYSDRVRIISHHNIGESATVNKGLSMSRGQYILVISADDPLLTGELINKAVEILDQNAEIVAVYPDWRIIDQYGKLLKTNILSDYSDQIMIGRSRCLPGPGVVFSKVAALKIGGRQAQWKYVGDYDFWLRLSRIGKIERLPGVLAQWRSNENSTSISQRGQEMAYERIRVIEKFLVENKIPKSLARKALGNAYYLAARLAFFDSNINGRSLLLKAFKYRRGWPEESRVHIVIYLLLLPISSVVQKIFPSITAKIASY